MTYLQLSDGYRESIMFVTDDCMILIIIVHEFKFTFVQSRCTVVCRAVQEAGAPRIP